MARLVGDKKGITLAEIMFAAVISIMVVSTVVSVWIYTQRTWRGEIRHTSIRTDMIKAIERLRSDIRLSSGTYMTFYPSGGSEFSAISMPLATTDSDGFFLRDGSDKISWSKTVIYHIVSETGVDKLRRTVINSWDSALDATGRYSLLTNVVNGTNTGASHEDLIKKDLQAFEITTLSPVIDFYYDSSDPVKVRNVVFGYAKLSSGSHTVKFKVTGKNDDSTGYAFGLDTIKIEPAGYPREAEYYNSAGAPSGALSSGGSTLEKVSGSMWSNNNYLEYNATFIDDYIEITDGYDLVRESAFDNTTRNNTTKFDADVKIKLELPEDREDDKNMIAWSAYSQTGAASQDGADGYLPAYPIVIRTIVKNGYMDMAANAVRVRFKAPSSNPTRIDAAYLTRKTIQGTDTDPDGLANQDPSGLTVSEYHRHQRLFFSEEDNDIDMNGDGDKLDILDYANIPSGGEIWSVWTAFPMVREDADGDPVDLLITVSIPDLSSVSFPSGWEGFDSSDCECREWTGSVCNSQYMRLADIGGGTGTYTNILQAAGTPDWSDATYVPVASNNVYFAMDIDTWDNEGTVESQVYDTTISSPSYSQIKWNGSTPSGTSIVMKARSSDNDDMQGASSWDTLTGTSTNPGSLGIGSGRYAQFQAVISTDMGWEWSGGTLSYVAYITEQAAATDPWEFPYRSGEPLVTGYDTAWLDDVEMTWAGEEQICVIKGDIVKEDDFGQVEVTVDSSALVRVLRVELSASAEVNGRVLTESNVLEVEPRNTGK
ncbi:MAG: hypothetical protein PHH49_05450 [Candidatus Omnitrophica bacterium]|nr:hypothetical protein [Candidatus Omnitrophota bacterium]MDD5488388.1 hypothetical protein [Candidatus Omnitrophota bacterium]